MSRNVFLFGDSAFLGKSSSAVIFNDSRTFTDDTKDSTISVSAPSEKGVKMPSEINFVAWGKKNDMPLEIIKKVYKNVTVASNIDFNNHIAYGDGLMVVRKVRGEDRKITYEEVLPSDEPEIFEFLDNNNFKRIMQECANDLVTFYDADIALVIDSDEKTPKIATARHREITFSRLSEANDQNIIEYHGYSAKWHEGNPDDIVISAFLDRDAPIYDLKKRLGYLPDEKSGKPKPTGEKRFVLSLALPTPGRFYYNKPYWWSIFESGWYDFSCAIPEFKKALIDNKMTLQFHIKINNAFWEKLYASEGITDQEKKKARQTEFLMHMDDFLAGKENAGKSFVSYFGYDQIKGYEVHDIIITPLKDANDKGGEHIEDSEEASNMICYAMGVHPSLQGASPGKNKSINGTEARELFIIKQAMTKPLRDALLLPLYLIKAINGWNPDIHFVIPNIMLTTLDKNTGSEKSIGNQPI